MRLQEALEWLALAAIWGASFLFTRIAVPEFGPFAIAELRLLIASAYLAVPVLIYGHWHQVRTHWKALLVLGLTNSAIPFTLFAWAMKSMSAGDASVLNATAPLFAAALGWLVLQETLSLRRTIGLGIGFMGVVVLVWDKLTFSDSIWSQLACLLAAFLYGVASHIINRKLKGVPPVAVSFGSLFFSSMALFPLIFLKLPPEWPSWKGWLAVVALGMLCTATAYLVYYRLLKKIGPTPAMTIAYAIPAFSMLWGWLWLDELVSFSTIFGGAVIIVGTVLVQWPEKKLPAAT